MSGRRQLVSQLEPRARAVSAVLVTIAAIAALSAPSTASAFCRTRTVKDTVCTERDANGCSTCGLPLWWRRRCVGYTLHDAASSQVALRDVERLTARAFAKWTTALCPVEGGEPQLVGLEANYLGPVVCGRKEYNEDGPNQNVIAFRDAQWPYAKMSKTGIPEDSNTLALTTVKFDTDTGEIRGADIEINSHDATFSARDEVNAEEFDLEGILVHELGHFIGLAHSPDQTATMRETTSPGRTDQRDLAPDDVAAVCEVYRPNLTRAVGTSVAPSGFVSASKCDPFPANGFSVQCAPPKDPPGCATAPARESGGSPLPLAALSAVAVALAARRGRRLFRRFRL